MQISCIASCKVISRYLFADLGEPSFFLPRPSNRSAPLAAPDNRTGASGLRAGLTVKKIRNCHWPSRNARPGLSACFRLRWFLYSARHSHEHAHCYLRPVLESDSNNSPQFARMHGQDRDGAEETPKKLGKASFTRPGRWDGAPLTVRHHRNEMQLVHLMDCIPYFVILDENLEDQYIHTDIAACAGHDAGAD